MQEWLHPAVARWFDESFPHGPTEAQRKAIPLIAQGESVLLSSPTGTGKTLAGFLAILSDLFARAEAAPSARPAAAAAGRHERDGGLPARVDTIYVSPLKALANDVTRNLDAPLRGIEMELGWPHGAVRVAMRTGETTRRERERMAKDPPHLLVTTPESLALLLGSPRWEPLLKDVRRIIVDEMHALAETKRGQHLALTLERLEQRLDRPLQRIGMSATVRPLEEAASFLTGGRPCRVACVTHGKQVALVAGLVHPDPLRARGGDVEDALYERLDDTITRSKSTLVFTSTRATAERMVQTLRRRYGDKYGSAEDDEEAAAATSKIAPHHGSMSKESRLIVEERLKRSDLKCVVTSTSLELGVHVDDVDEVVMLGSPKYVSRALQRVGRSGHHVGASARGVMLCGEPDELAECAAIAKLVAEREVEPLRIRAGGLDVLAQHLAAMGAERTFDVEEALAITRRAWPYRDLSREDLDAVLRHLRDDARLLAYDGARFSARNRAASITLAQSGGTIPRSGLVKVLCGERFVGEVEEGFAENLEEGDVFQLAGEPWRFVSPAILAIHVQPARGRDATVPDWRSEGLAASRLVLEETNRILESGEAPPGSLGSEDAARMLREFVALQRRVAEAPTRDKLLVESCLTDLGARAIVFHALLGRRANEALAMALAPRFDPWARVVTAETGFALIVPRATRVTAASLRAAFAQPLRDTILPDLHASEALRRRFRHVAQRGLLVRDARRGRAQKRAGWWLRRWLESDPEHPLLREARREVLEDVMDVDEAERYRAAVADGRVPWKLLAPKPHASPFAACILVPRMSSPGARAALLRDHFERWKEKEDLEGAPQRGGG